MLRLATRFLRPGAVLSMFCALGTGCFSADKRRAMPPPTPMDNFTPLPDPRDAKMKAAADRQRAAPKAAPIDNSWNVPPGAEPPKPAIPPLPEPGAAPKPLSSREDGGAKPLARASSEELSAPPADRAANELAALLERASARLATLQSVESRLTMRDVKEGKAQPVEVVRFQHRPAPYAVRMTWTGEQHRGRDILYVAGKYDGKLQMLTARGDIPLMMPQLMAFSPDDPMLKARSKHDIRDAGPAFPLRHLQNVAQPKTFAGRLADKGLTERPDWKGPLRLVEETVPAGDRELPRGGRRQFYFDAAEGSPTRDLPVAITATETGGRNSESMVFDQFRCNHLGEGDFDVRKLGK